MRANVIAIGDELTTGQRLDTNSQWIARELGVLGLAVGLHLTVPDDLEAGIAAGIGRRFLVRCNGEGERPAPGDADESFDDLAHCVASLSEAARDRAPG